MQYARGISTLAVFVGLFLPATTPSVRAASDASSQKRIVSHVEHLAHPSLKGRGTGTRGAALARDYIARHFHEAGLHTWAGCDSYEIPFGFGKNMIGILPGSDPARSMEYILVSAHYDHEGKRDGKIHPGAADNASGVAVLLEMARRLKSNPPARPVIFAAFDAEEKMMLGSFAFSDRQDVLETRLLGVINIDMLGRNFLNVTTNAVFVAGTESYPDLRRQVCDAGDRERLRVLPIGTDIVGPRSDHVAFENRNVPCLFFSCGTFSDYHRPTDTPDKLDYPAVTRSAAVILETTRAMANGTVALHAVSNDFAAAELATIGTVLAEATANATQIGLRKSDLPRFRDLELHVRTLLTNGNVTAEQREQLAVEATGILAPYVSFFGDSGENSSEDQRAFEGALARLIQGFYFNYRPEALELCRAFASHLSANRPGVFRGMPKFKREIYRMRDRDISVVRAEGDRLRLNVAFPRLELTAGVKRSRWLINSFWAVVGIQMILIDGEGSLEELQDLCLLTVHQERQNPEHCRELMKVWTALDPTAETETYEVLLNERLARGGFSNELQWVIHCLEHPNPGVQLRALMASGDYAGQALDDALATVLGETNSRPDLLTAAIERVTLHQPASARVLCGLLWNSEPLQTARYPWAAPDYPFRNRPMSAALLAMFARQNPNAKRIGDLAYEQLKKISGRDFGRDEMKWLRWLKSHRHTAAKQASTANRPDPTAAIPGSPDRRRG